MNAYDSLKFPVDFLPLAEPTLGGSFFKTEESETAGEPLNLDQIIALQHQFAADLAAVAPDLGSNGLADCYAEQLFRTLINKGATSLEQLVAGGAEEFYMVGRGVLGPLAAAFTDTVLRQVKGGKVIFPARDATPFFCAARALASLQPDAYRVGPANFQNPVFNRKLWGINDELDSGAGVMLVTHPLVQKLLGQMGFSAPDDPVTFVEVGCWGTMVDQLNRAMQQGAMPNKSYSVYFLYSHLPEIYGLLNNHAGTLPESVLERIADTWEAFPKSILRPTQLVEDEGLVKAVLEGKIVNSPFMSLWTQAALQGVVDAAADYVAAGSCLDIHQEILRLQSLSVAAQQGVFTGMLPTHTETWSEGEEWKANWQWGSIPPLIEGAET